MLLPLLFRRKPAGGVRLRTRAGSEVPRRHYRSMGDDDSAGKRSIRGQVCDETARQAFPGGEIPKSCAMNRRTLVGASAAALFERANAAAPRSTFILDPESFRHHVDFFNGMVREDIINFI